MADMAVQPEPAPSRGTPVSRQPDGVTLSSSVVVDQMAFSNNNGIPLAAVVDFVPPASLQLPQITRQPERCKSCAAYMNAYCKTNLEKGVWRCSFCGQANMDKEFLGKAQGQLPELLQEAVEYVFPAPPPSTRPPAPPHLVIAVDATADEAMLQNLRSGLLDALSSLDPSTRVSLLSFDSVVSLHNLSGPDTSTSASAATPASASFSLTLPGGAALDPALLGAYLAGGVRGPGGRAAVLTVELGSGMQQIQEALQSIRPLEEDLPLLQRPRCLGIAVEAALHLLSPSPPRPASDAPPASGSPPRAPRGSRVLLLTSGPCTRGPAAVSLAALEAGAGFNHKAPGAGISREEREQLAAADKYVAGLVDMAADLGAPVDVILGGSLRVHAPLLSTLVRDSRGLLLLHRDFGPSLSPSLKALFSRCFGSSAVLDCYVSDGLRLVQWLGPVQVLQVPEPEDVGLAMARDRRLSSSACSIARLQEGHGAALKLEVLRNLEPPAVLVQVVLQFIDPSIGGRLVQRVTTRRLPVVSRIADFLPGVNAEVAAVVLAKKAVLDTRKQGALWSQGKAEELRYALRAQFSLIASRCGREVQLSGGLLGFGVRKARLLPPQLLPLAQALFQLQRPGGLLFGPPKGGREAGADIHADARLLRMNMLLSAGGAASLLTVLPRLFQWRGEGQGLQELPAVDIMTLLAARGQQQGAAAAEPPPLVLLVHAGCRTLALPVGGAEGQPAAGLPDGVMDGLLSQVIKLGAGTWPAPELVVLGAGAEAEARALLLPLAGATAAEVAAQVPDILRVVSEQELGAAQQRLLREGGGAGAESFVQWCQAAGVQVTEQYIQ